IVDSFGIRVRGHEREIGRLVFYRDLPGVVVRIGDISGEAVVLAKGWSQFVSRPKHLFPIGLGIGLLFAVRSASRSAREDIGGVAEHKTKCLIPRICVVLSNEEMTLRSNVRQGQQFGSRTLSLKGQIVMLRVRQAIVDVVTRGIRDWQVTGVVER